MRTSRLLILLPIAHSLAAPLPTEPVDLIHQAEAPLQSRRIQPLHTPKLEARGFNPIGFVQNQWNQVQNQWNRFQTWRTGRQGQPQTSPSVPQQKPSSPPKKPGPIKQGFGFVKDKVTNNIQKFRSGKGNAAGGTLAEPQQQQAPPNEKAKQAPKLKAPDRFRTGFDLVDDKKFYQLLSDQEQDAYHDCVERQISKMPGMTEVGEIMYEVLRGNQVPPPMTDAEKARVTEDGWKHYEASQKFCMGIQRDKKMMERKKQEAKLREMMGDPDTPPSTDRPLVPSERQKTPSISEFADQVGQSAGSYLFGTNPKGAPGQQPAQAPRMRVPGH